MLRFSPCLPRSLFSLVFCLSSIVFSAARAADFDAERMEPEREWAVIVSPYVWAASLKGNASLAGFDTDVDVPFSEIFDHLDLALMGNVEVTNGKWGVYFDGQHVQTSQDERVFAHEIGIDIKTTTLAAGAFFKAYEVELGGQTVFGKPRTISFEPTVGVRWTELEADVSAFGVSSTKSSDWADPFIGLRMNADLTDRWNLFAEADVGGFDVGSKVSVNAQAYLGYRMEMLGKPTILRAGYRLLYQDYENDDFTGANKFRWDVSQHGPVVGFSMRF
ncbi:hypothetical protein AS026_07980 [Rhizobium altiplani]|uniref:Outer membrane protein beta-barrel domain-containing protein n=1 Tax=Rhizobium altiplani TaxID=1864509 RepID=A0A109JKS3_9HYPH|nr:hypothetical protein [Rhizobium altiplani]KWV50698.1 hypothetical protein AS026_07980 [Rhizobium altiplani]